VTKDFGSYQAITAVLDFGEPPQIHFWTDTELGLSIIDEADMPPFRWALSPRPRPACGRVRANFDRSGLRGN
jgi:hypothetical protein